MFLISVVGLYSCKDIYEDVIFDLFSTLKDPIRRSIEKDALTSRLKRAYIYTRVYTPHLYIVMGQSYASFGEESVKSKEIKLLELEGASRKLHGRVIVSENKDRSTVK